MSGGVVANRAIRETIRAEVTGAGFTLVINNRTRPGDGCVSFGQCIWAGTLLKDGGEQVAATGILKKQAFYLNTLTKMRSSLRCIRWT